MLMDTAAMKQMPMQVTMPEFRRSSKRSWRVRAQPCLGRFKGCRVTSQRPVMQDDDEQDDKRRRQVDQKTGEQIRSACYAANSLTHGNLMWFGLGPVSGLPPRSGPLCFSGCDNSPAHLVKALTAGTIYFVVNLAEKVVGARLSRIPDSRPSARRTSPIDT
jgi:hypothetical protein